MNKFQKVISSPIFLGAALAGAIGLIGFSSVGGTQAALTYVSEYYSSRVEMYDIGVSLLENDTVVSMRDYVPNSDASWIQEHGTLLSGLIPEGEEFEVSTPYKEELSIKNSGTINTYNRVTVYKYWFDEDGNKSQVLDPKWIDLHLINQDVWILDEGSTTDERIVLYYSKLLNAGEQSVPFTDTISIDGELHTVTSTETTTENGWNIITYTYDYEGVTFCIEAEVDAVQEHNAEDAILSAWGRKVNIANNTMSIN